LRPACGSSGDIIVPVRLLRRAARDPTRILVFLIYAIGSPLRLTRVGIVDRLRAHLIPCSMSAIFIQVLRHGPLILRLAAIGLRCFPGPTVARQSRRRHHRLPPGTASAQAAPANGTPRHHTSDAAISVQRPPLAMSVASAESSSHEGHLHGRRAPASVIERWVQAQSVVQKVCQIRQGTDPVGTFGLWTPGPQPARNGVAGWTLARRRTVDCLLKEADQAWHGRTSLQGTSGVSTSHQVWLISRASRKA